MTWFVKEIDYARDSLKEASREAIEHASDKIAAVLREGIADASGELRHVVSSASSEVDDKLEKISHELHNQRHLTKGDVKELVDYAADRLGDAVDTRVRLMRDEISDLIQDRIEYLKGEVDAFFIERQRDLARERRRLMLNVLIAVAASVVMGGVSVMYHRVLGGTLDVYGVFRIVLLSLTGGYVVYLVVRFIRRYRSMSEHKKDLFFLAMKYWGVLRPRSLFGHLALVMLLIALYAMLFFPAQTADFARSTFGP